MQQAQKTAKTYKVCIWSKGRSERTSDISKKKRINASKQPFSALWDVDITAKTSRRALRFWIFRCALGATFTPLSLQDISVFCAFRIFVGEIGPRAVPSLCLSYLCHTHNTPPRGCCYNSNKSKVLRPFTKLLCLCTLGKWVRCEPF